MKTRETNSPIFGVPYSTKFRISAYELHEALNRGPFKKKKTKTKLRRHKAEVPSTAPEVLISSVDDKIKNKFVKGLDKTNKALYQKLLELGQMELALPTAYADFEESLKLMANNREIKVNSNTVQKAMEEFVEMSVVRFIGSKLSIPASDVERVIARKWPMLNLKYEAKS